MKGSEKQIKWAEEIRAQFIAKADEALEQAKANPANTPDMIATGQTNHDIIVKGLMAIDDASYFIDHRYGCDNEVTMYAYELGQIEATDDAEDDDTETADDADQVDQVAVIVPTDRVFKTRYGWGLILDHNHVQWLDKHRVYTGFSEGHEVTLRHDEWNPKMAKRPYEGYDVDDNETKWSTWVARAED